MVSIVCKVLISKIVHHIYDITLNILDLCLTSTKISVSNLGKQIKTHLQMWTRDMQIHGLFYGWLVVGELKTKTFLDSHEEVGVTEEKEEPLKHPHSLRRD